MQAAFRELQNGNHIGKVVVRIPEDAAAWSTTMAQHEELLLKESASYLLTGGLGGLGKVISTWLVERGARSLIFLSRSAGKTAEDQDFFRELSSLGCSVCAVPGRAESMDDVKRAILQVPYPIRGVIHLAMVLRVS